MTYDGPPLRRRPASFLTRYTLLLRPQRADSLPPRRSRRPRISLADIARHRAHRRASRHAQPSASHGAPNRRPPTRHRADRSTSNRRSSVATSGRRPKATPNRIGATTPLSARRTDRTASALYIDTAKDAAVCRSESSPQSAIRSPAEIPASSKSIWNLHISRTRSEKSLRAPERSVATTSFQLSLTARSIEKPFIAILCFLRPRASLSRGPHSFRREYRN